MMGAATAPMRSTAVPEQNEFGPVRQLERHPVPGADAQVQQQGRHPVGTGVELGPGQVPGVLRPAVDHGGVAGTFTLPTGAPSPGRNQGCLPGDGAVPCGARVVDVLVVRRRGTGPSCTCIDRPNEFMASRNSG